MRTIEEKLVRLLTHGGDGRLVAVDGSQACEDSIEDLQEAGFDWLYSEAERGQYPGEWVCWLGSALVERDAVDDREIPNSDVASSINTTGTARPDAACEAHPAWPESDCATEYYPRDVLIAGVEKLHAEVFGDE